MPAVWTLLQRQIKLESGGGGKITLHGTQPNAVLWRFEEQIKFASSQTTRFWFGHSEDIPRYSQEQTTWQQYLAAGEMRSLSSSKSRFQMLCKGGYGGYAMVVAVSARGAVLFRCRSSRRRRGRRGIWCTFGSYWSVRVFSMIPIWNKRNIYSITEVSTFCPKLWVPSTAADKYEYWNLLLTKPNRVN